MKFGQVPGKVIKPILGVSVVIMSIWPYKTQAACTLATAKPRCLQQKGKSIYHAKKRNRNTVWD